MDSSRIFNEKVLEIGWSKIRQYYDLAKGMKDVIDFSIGQPDFATPQHIIEAAKKALDEGYTRYTPNPGLPELREAVAKTLNQDSIKANPESEILITIGAAEGIFLAIQTLVNQGDEVIITDPCFDMYEPHILLARGKPIHVLISEENNFEIDSEALEKAISKKTKIIVLNTPNNPTGATLSKKTLKEISQLSIDYDVFVVSDEPYDKFVYDDAKHYAIGSFPGMEDRTVTIKSFSKTYSMAGWRLGAVTADEQITRQMLKVHRNTVTCAAAFVQKAAVTALQGDQTCVKEMIVEYNRRRKFSVKRINEIDGISCLPPKGAFYMFPNTSGLHKSSEELAKYLVEKAHVVTVPGTGFGKNGENHIRLSYTMPLEKIAEAMDRMEKALKDL